MSAENGTGEVNTEVEQATGQEAAAEGLSLRDALEVAIQATSDGEEQKAEPAAAAQEVTEEAETTPPLDAPAEFSNPEKDAFRSLPRPIQEATLRLHRSRMSRLEEIKQASREYDDTRKLAEAVRPFVKAMGVNLPAEVALQKALALFNEFETDDPKKAAKIAASYLKRKGAEQQAEALLKTIQDSNTSNDNLKEVISPLRDELNALKMEREAEKTQAEASQLRSIWNAFSSAKNEAGLPRFPDIQDPESETSNRLASEIGSLVSGRTELSQDFISRIRTRIPNANFETLLTEAYRYVGGRVDESRTQTRTQQDPKHIQQARRASASVPGRGGVSPTSGVVKKYDNYRDAAAAALRELNGE